MFIDKIPITSEKVVSFTGYFDLGEIYSRLKDFMGNSEHYDIAEKELVEQNQQGKRKIDSHIEAEMQYNDYYKIIVKLRLEASGKETTIEHAGKSIKVTNGTVSIKLNSYIECDWQKKRGTSPFAKFIDQVYNKYISKEELEKAAGVGSQSIGRILAEYKKLTNMYIK